MHDLLQVPKKYTHKNDLFLHDVVDVTRQMIQNKIDVIYQQVINAFNNKDLRTLNKLSNTFQKLLLDLDRILTTHKNFLLGNWLESAKALATTQLEKQNYEYNARIQITIWGPDGQIVDYATKQWAGMVKDYCLPRWQLFLDELANSIRGKNAEFDNEACQRLIFRKIEEPFGISRKLYTTSPIGNTMSIAKEIYYKYRYITPLPMNKTAIQLNRIKL